MPELGDIREDIGILKGTVAGIKDSVEHLDEKLDDHQRTSIAAHIRLDSNIAKIQNRLDVMQGVKRNNNALLGHAWTAFYTLMAAGGAALATWLGIGNGGAHP